MYLKASPGTSRIACRDGERVVVAEFQEQVAKVSDKDGKLLLQGFPGLEKLTAAQVRKLEAAEEPEDGAASNLGAEPEEE